MHGRIGTGVRAFRRLGALTALGGLLAPLSASTWAAPVARAEVGTFGKTSIGGSKEVLAANRKRVNEYPLSAAGAISQLSVYLQPSTVSGQQQIEGVIYADSNGAPRALLAVSQQLTFESTQPAGWYPLVFPVAVELPAGNYWIGLLSGNSWGVAGFRYDTVPASKAFNHNYYTAGPSNPFGAFSTDGQQMSLYATYGPPRSSVPANTSSPTISGTAEQGQTLTEHNGEWTNSPSGYAYQWLQCDAFANGCLPIQGATQQTYVPTPADVGHTIRVQETASNAGGSGGPAQSAPTAAVVTAPPASTSPPTIAGEARHGQALTEHNGEWTNSPTSYAYQWQQCDGSGNNCAVISGATKQTYVPTASDVGHTIRVQETASNAAGSSAPASSEATALVVPPVPTIVKVPAIAGEARQGQTLTEHNGEWTNAPTGYAYQWQRCDGSGNNCTAISGANIQTYVTTEADVGHTLRVAETASNAGGAGSPANASATAPVTAKAATATFGKTSVGALRDGGMFANYKIVHSATLSASGSVTKLSLYAIPGSHSPSPQSLKAVIFADSGGSPGALLATGTEVVYRGNVNGTGWLDLPLASPVALSQGTYWLGFITGAESGGLGYAYDRVAGSRAYNTNAYASGPSNPFGAASRDSEQASIYASYQPSALVKPVDETPPTINGTAQQGSMLAEEHGKWTNEPTGYAVNWQQCDSEGNSCAAIGGGTGQSYVPSEADVGHRLRVLETASNAAGPGNPVQSAPTAVVTASSGSVSHLEYVLQDGTTSVYDMDHEFKLVRTISMPQDKNEVRGVSVAPATHIMYVMHGGDGPTTTGSVLAWDLVQEKVAWDVKLSTGIDSGQVSPDATKLYVPTGELDPSGIWNILSAANGELLGTIHGGSGAHNTVVSNDGQYVYLGGRGSNVLRIYETSSGKIKEIGPLVGSVRPLTANGKNTLVFTTATGFDGFQVSSVTTSKVLFTISFGEVPSGFQFTAPSHGISLSPDETRVYVVDAVHKQVQVWDVSKVAEGTAPTQVGVVPVAGWSGTESPCVYDCGRHGWLQTSLDGRYLFAGDSGEVIDTSTLKVITTLSTLAQTKKSIEVDWRNGVPIATSGRTGVGYVK